MEERTEQIAKMILGYLRRNPDAGDTVEGIARWWMDAQRIESSVDDVADALESLVEQGMIRIRDTNGNTIFCANDGRDWCDDLQD